MNSISADLLFVMLIGHFLGLYLFQTNTINKMKRYVVKWSLCHCAIYTVSVTACIAPIFIKDVTSILYLAIFGIFTFVSRFVIDRFDLVDKSLQIIGSRSIKNTDQMISDSSSKVYSMYAVAQTIVTQTLVDNTLQIAGLYLLIKVLANFSS